jgi:hypothetical protein
VTSLAAKWSKLGKECPKHPGFHLSEKYGCPRCEVEEYREWVKARRHQRAVIKAQRLRNLGSNYANLNTTVAESSLVIQERKVSKLLLAKDEFRRGSIWGPWRVIGAPEEILASNNQPALQVRVQRVAYPTVKEPMNCVRYKTPGQLRAQGKRNEDVT